MTKTAKVVVIEGPPGTGKTTELAKSTKKAVERYQDRGCMIVASLTNAAAHNIAARDTGGLNPRNVGTLHALCARHMPGFVLAENHLDDWNKTHPDYRMSGVMEQTQSPEQDRPMAMPIDEDDGKETEGDILLQKMSILWHQCTPVDAWPQNVQTFHTAWERWKDKNGYTDFDGMIAFGATMEEPPFGARLGLVDEAQDLSKREWETWLHWASMMDYVMVAGDSYQGLYNWRGGDSTYVDHMDPPPVERRVLPQTYRLPIKVQEYCETWAEQLSDRTPRLYAPKDEPGMVQRSPDNLRQIHYTLDLIKEAQDKDKTLMILTACNYQLRGLIRLLKDRGIAFGNSWRPSQGDWNPLGGKGKKGSVSSVQRMLSFLAPRETGRLTWTATELKQWAAVCPVSTVFNRGAKAAIEDLPQSDEPVDMGRLSQWIKSEVLEKFLTAPTGYMFVEYVTEAKKKHLGYIARVENNYGVKGITELPPKLTTGTIHSVKGGASEWVLIFPDISPKGFKQWMSWGPGRDAVIRQFYVGCSRASERLYLGSASTREAISWL